MRGKLERLLSWAGLSESMTFFFSSRRRHTRLQGDWSSDVCSSDLWLNWLTILAAVAGIADPVVRDFVPFVPSVAAGGAFGATPAWFTALVLAVAALVIVLSWWPVRNMASPRQAMNASFNPFHIVNTYGAFGSVGRQRYELIVEGTDAAEAAADAIWREYEFKGKPGDPGRLPPQVA